MKRMRRVVLVLTALSLLLLVGNGYWIADSWRRNIIVSVPDGDSLDLADGRRVRLLGIDSPERGRCMADEARAKLIELAQGRHVRLKEIVKDDFGRQLGMVFAGEVLLQQELVGLGLARNRSATSNPYYRVLIDAQEVAKSTKRGIWSDACRGQTSGKDDCVIKGNIRGGKKQYYFPNCPYYPDVLVDTAFGDEWFCSDDEASQAGFAPASSCFALDKPSSP